MSVEFPFAAGVEAVPSAHPAPAATASAQAATATHGSVQDGSGMEQPQVRDSLQKHPAFHALVLSEDFIYLGFDLIITVPKLGQVTRLQKCTACFMAPFLFEKFIYLFFL